MWRLLSLNQWIHTGQLLISFKLPPCSGRASSRRNVFTVCNFGIVAVATGHTKLQLQLQINLPVVYHYSYLMSENWLTVQFEGLHLLQICHDVWVERPL